MSSWVLSQKCSSNRSIWKHSLRGLLVLVPIWQLLISLSFCKSSTPSPKLTRVRDNEPLCSASPYDIEYFLFCSCLQVLQIAVLIVTTKSASVNQKLLYCDSIKAELIHWWQIHQCTNASPWQQAMVISMCRKAHFSAFCTSEYILQFKLQTQISICLLL